MAGYRKSVFEDVAVVAPKLSDEDVEEIRLSTGSPPLPILAQSFANSEGCYTMFNDADEPFGMFGYSVENEVSAAIWMLTSREIEQYGHRFLREGRELVSAINRRFPVLYNFVHTENERAIRWLKWLGFDFIHLWPQFGPGRAPFYEFMRTP